MTKTPEQLVQEIIDKADREYDSDWRSETGQYWTEGNVFTIAMAAFELGRKYKDIEVLTKSL